MNTMNNEADESDLAEAVVTYQLAYLSDHHVTLCSQHAETYEGLGRVSHGEHLWSVSIFTLATRDGAGDTERRKLLLTLEAADAVALKAAHDYLRDQAACRLAELAKEAL